MRNLSHKSLIKTKKYKDWNLNGIGKKELIKLKNNKHFIIGYGAPARVSTITNVSKINSNLIEYIIDDSPLKQNRFTPGMHIKILPRKNNLEKKITIVIVFAYEYFRDIKKVFKNKKIMFFKPIPFRRLKWIN